MSMGSSGSASPLAGASVYSTAAKSAAVSAAAITASVYRRSCANSGSAGVMSGIPRRWPGRSARK